MSNFKENEVRASRLGELLLKSGLINELDLERALEISRKNFQALGKVLLISKTCKEKDINTALELQKLCKHERMRGYQAVAVLRLICGNGYTLPEALKKIEWNKDGYNSFVEPDSIKLAKQKLNEASNTSISAYANSLVNLAEAYSNEKLFGRAEIYFEEAIENYEKDLPNSVVALTKVIYKLAQSLVLHNRSDEARALFEKVQEILQSANLQDPLILADFLFEYAKFLISRRKYYEAENYLEKRFELLLPTQEMNSASIIDTIKEYAAITRIYNRESDKFSLGELLVSAKILSEDSLESALKHAKHEKVALGKALVLLSVLSEEQLEAALQIQLYVRNSEISNKLGVWILQYIVNTNTNLDEALQLFNCVPKSRLVFSNELNESLNKMVEVERQYGHDSEELGLIFVQIAKYYFLRQQWHVSEQFYQRAWKILENKTNFSSEKLIEILDLYADLKAAQEDYDEAIKISKNALQIRAKQYGQLSIPYARGIDNLAKYFCTKGDHETARSFMDGALTLRQKIYGPKVKELVPILVAKADCYMHSIDYKFAQETYIEAFEIAKENYELTNSIIIELDEKLANLYRLTGDVSITKFLINKIEIKNDLFI